MISIWALRFHRIQIGSLIVVPWMHTNRLGGTDLVVSTLGFGGFAIGGNTSGNSYGPTDDATSIAAIHAALDLGCNFFDTADVYGFGKSEEIIGLALKHAKRTNDVVIASKVGGNFRSGRTVMDFSRAHLVSAVEDSLRRLRREYLDLYQLHNPSLELIRSGEMFDAMDDLRISGKIRYYGVSIHTATEGEACLANGRPQTLQVPYNLFSLLDPEHSVEEIFETAVQKRVGLIAREPLAAGFLSGRHTLKTKYGFGDNRALWPVARRRLYIALANTLRRLERPKVTLAQAALRFVLDEPAISTTIVGMKTPQQVRENFAAITVPSFGELESIPAA
jgi:aryl-alcohol dehydrogenase-like predicted oxidoreductase